MFTKTALNIIGIVPLGFVVWQFITACIDRILREEMPLDDEEMDDSAMILRVKFKTPPEDPKTASGKDQNKGAETAGVPDKKLIEAGAAAAIAAAQVDEDAKKPKGESNHVYCSGNAIEKRQDASCPNLKFQGPRRSQPTRTEYRESAEQIISSIEMK